MNNQVFHLLFFTYIKHLMVGNGGLGNGVSRNELKPLFSQYGQLTDIVMLPRKPYSVICYTSVQEATMAYEKLQAWQLRPNDGAVSAIVLYLSFIDEGKFAFVDRNTCDFSIRNFISIN